jgi:hypothetical protein
VDNELEPGRRGESAEIQFRSESWALWLGFGCTVLGVVVGLIGFASHRPDLAGYHSVGVYSAILAGLTASSAT